MSVWSQSLCTASQDRLSRTDLLPSTSSLPQCVHSFNGLAGIRTQGLRLAKAALYQLSYKPGFSAQLRIINSWLVSLFGLGRHFQLPTGCGEVYICIPITLGGDPAADSPTATLLRLNPPCKAQIRTPPKEALSFRPYSGGLTGGVCKEQGRIHRVLLKRDYYGFQLHEGELQPSIRTKIGFRRFPSPFGVDTHCTNHCSSRVARDIRGILTYRCPFLPPL